MKKLGILLLACITAINLWAEEFKNGKLTFRIETPTTVRLSHADEDITKAFLSETIDYKGNSYTLTYIGNSAFSGCKSLTSVTIPNSVTSIGNSAFWDCTSLTSVTMPKGVTSIGSVAFKGTALYNNRSNWKNGALYIDNCLIKVDKGFAGHFCIKENTQVIANGAFGRCSSLTSVTIPNSVTSIGYMAFVGCFSLKSVTIPNSVTSIGDMAFYGTALYKNPANWENGALYIDDCLIKVDEDFAGHFRIKENSRVIARYAFKGCESLTSVTIPNSVTSIGEWAFNDCYSLTSVSIPNSVTSIESSTFKGCTSLVSVTIPKGVTSIGDGVFDDCSSLTSVTIPNSVTSIGVRAFSDCSSLTSVTIPNSVTSIGEWAFWGCSSLTSMVVASGNNTYDSRDNCNAIIETATNTLIAGCQNTTIPNSVTSIGDVAFAGCSSLTSMRIPNSVTRIGNGAFAGCFSLTSMRIPNSVTRIGNGAFACCTSLTSVSINSVTSIGYDAFPSHTKIIRRYSLLHILRILKSFVDNPRLHI